MKKSTFAVLVSGIALLASLQALAIEAPEDLPMVGLLPGAYIEITSPLVVPPSIALTAIGYQEGLIKSYFPVGQDPATAEPKALNGGLDEKKPVGWIYRRHSSSQFHVLTKKTRIQITLVDTHQGWAYTARSALFKKFACSRLDHSDDDQLTVAQFKSAFGEKLTVHMPPFDASEKPEQHADAELELSAELD